MCSNAFASSRLKRPVLASTVLSWTRVRPFVRVIVFFAPIGVPGHSGDVASGAGGNVERSFFSAIANHVLPWELAPDSRFARAVLPGPTRADAPKNAPTYVPIMTREA